MSGNYQARVGQTGRYRATVFFMICSILLCCTRVSAQKEVPTLGFELRPIIPSGLFANTSLQLTNLDRSFNVVPEASFSFGAIMRHGLHKQFAFETGIYYMSRTYRTDIKGDSAGPLSSKMHFVNYEVPFLGLIYIRLGKDLYLNTAFGVSMDFFPNDVEVDVNQYRQIARRRYWVLPALMADVGAEYRTKTSGYFYIGGTYHRMLVPMARMGYLYVENNYAQDVETNLDGHYFGISLKYFFPTYRTAPIEYD